MDRDEILKLLEKEEGNKLEFMKEVYTEEYLREVGLNERQIKAVMYVKERGRIKNREYQEIVNVSRQTASRDLSDLVDKEILTTMGTGKRDFYYVLNEAKMRQKRHKGDTMGA